MQEKGIPQQRPMCKVRSLRAFSLSCVLLGLLEQSARAEWLPKEVSHAKIEHSSLQFRIILDIPWSVTNVHPFMLT